MEKAIRCRNTLEYKQEAVRLVASGQKVAAVEGTRLSRGQVQGCSERAMLQNGLRVRGKRRFRVVTTDSNHALPVATSLLSRNFTVVAPNTVRYNASSETLFGSLKVEILHGEQFKTHRGGKDAVIDWLLWYNRSRMPRLSAIKTQLGSSGKLTHSNMPSQPDSEGATAAGRKSHNQQIRATRSEGRISSLDHVIVICACCFTSSSKMLLACCRDELSFRLAAIDLMGK